MTTIGQVTSSVSQDRTRSAGPRRAALPGSIGYATLVSMVVLCFATLPWTLGKVAGPESRGARYEAGVLELNLLPPTPLRLSSEARETEVQRRGDGLFVPNRWFGTDRFGRSVFARVLLGGAVSLAIGLSAAIIAVSIGTLVGGLSGFVGGRLDAALMRTVDILYGLPYILLVVLISVASEGIVRRLGLDPASWVRQLLNVGTLLVAIGGVGWLTTARVIRGQVLSLREQPFMEACRAQGMGATRQFIRHLLPNLVGPIVVYGTLAVPAAILSESFLSFLGIGVQEPLPSWGNLASEGLGELNTVRSHWWLLLWPCLFIAATLLSLNLVGDRLKARFDPTHASA